VTPNDSSSGALFTALQEELDGIDNVDLLIVLVLDWFR
jgi:hypothetical protein